MPRYIGYKPTGTANSSVSITAISPISPFSADGVLVVAGGGAGGGNPGYYKGGGGAGGYRAFTNVPILAGTSYTVVVGAGGAAPSVTHGSPSSFSGPNLPAPTYTSEGGGHGNQIPWPGGTGNGGSGGGLPGYQSSPQKVGNTPPTSPPQGNSGGVGSFYGAGGGGGAGGNGGAGSGNGKGGNGGPGATWAFNGTTYAGGGGGGNGQGDPGSFGAGGPGGGGRGSGGGGGGGQAAVSGTTNTGGGGGGRSNPSNTPASGGSGIVIVAVPPSIAPAITGGTQSVAPAPAGGKTLITSTSPDTLTVAATSVQTTVNKKYNSGIWSISGTGTSSVYGRRKQGNWLTTNRGAGGPPGSYIEYRIWGAGGGGPASPAGHAGGGGGAGTGYILFPELSAPVSLTLIVGKGGTTTIPAAPYPGVPNPNNHGGGGTADGVDGGGYSGIFLGPATQANALVIAGGGGSAGSGFSVNYSRGGHGGGVGDNGSNGYRVSDPPEPYGDIGLAGTTSAAGLGGGGYHPTYGAYKNPVQNPTNPSPPGHATNNGGDGGALTGGSTGDGLYRAGGGGGGYYGGGAGGAHTSPNIYYNGGGGGGSGYIISTSPTVVNSITVRSTSATVSYPGGPGDPTSAPAATRNFGGPGWPAGPVTPVPIYSANYYAGNDDAPYYTPGIGVGGGSASTASRPAPTPVENGIDGQIQIAINGGGFTTYSYTGSSIPIIVTAPSTIPEAIDV